MTRAIVYSNTGILELRDWKKEKSRTNRKRQGGNSLSCHRNTWMLVSKLRKMLPSWKILRCLRHHANHHSHKGRLPSKLKYTSVREVYIYTYIYIHRNMWNIYTRAGKAWRSSKPEHVHAVSGDTSLILTNTEKKTQCDRKKIYEVPKQAWGHSSKFLYKMQNWKVLAGMRWHMRPKQMDWNCSVVRDRSLTIHLFSTGDAYYHGYPRMNKPQVN